MTVWPLPRPHRPDLLAAACFFIAALLMRIIAFGQEAFSFDEVITARACETGVWRHVAGFETSPPLYFFLIKGWSLLFGVGHEALRSFSVIAGALAVPALYLSGRVWNMSRMASGLAALMLTVSPMAIWYSQQARQYSLLCLFAVMYFLALGWTWREPTRLRLLLLGSTLLLGFSTHYFHAFLALGMIPFLAAGVACPQHRRTALRIVTVHAVAGILSLSYFPLLLHQLSAEHTAYIPAPRMRDLLSVYTDTFIAGPFHRLHGALVAVYAGSFLLFSVVIWKASSSPGSRLRHLAVLGAVLTPVIVPFLVSTITRPFFLGDRYPIIALPFYLLLFGSVADVLRGALARRVAASLLAAGIAIPALYYDARYYQHFQDFDWRGAVDHVAREARENDVLLFLPAWLNEAYVNNGGMNHLTAHPNERERLDAAGTIFLFAWEQNPNEQEQQLYSAMTARPGAIVRIDFGHIRLWEIPTPDQQGR